MAENVILRDDELANLDPQKLEQAKKRFQKTTYEVTRDVAPVTGEYQSYKYAMQDAADIAKAAKGEEGYEDMTPIEALGKVGMVGLGVLGMIPVVGYGPRLIRKGISSLMPQRGPRTTEPTTLQATERSVQEYQEFSPETRTRMEGDPGFTEYVLGLPEYRQSDAYFDVNLREYAAIPEGARRGFERAGNRRIIESTDERMPPGVSVSDWVMGAADRRIVDAETGRVLNASERELYTRNNRPTMTQRQFFDQRRAKEKEAKLNELTAQDQERYNKINADFESKTIANSSKAVAKSVEPLNFGKTAQYPTDTTRDYIGSEAFDYVNKFGKEEATAQEWLGFMKGARQKGVKAEELADSGILMFKGNDAVGGELFNMAKINPQQKITKQEVLAVLETNPAFNMKTKNYNYPINEDDILKMYTNFNVNVVDAERIITNKINSIENVAERTPYNQLLKQIRNQVENLDSIASKLSSTSSQTASATAAESKLIELLDNFDVNDRQILQNLVTDLGKMKNISQLGEGATAAPRWKSDFPAGGSDYREKVIYYDKPIPGNSDPKRVYSSHFNEPNAVVFTRYNTRSADHVGDTLFVVEVQSDPHQSLAKNSMAHRANYKKKLDGNENYSDVINPDTMNRKNPFANKITERNTKTEIRDIRLKIKQITDKANKEALFKSDFDELENLRRQLKTAENRNIRRPVMSTDGAERISNPSGMDSFYDKDKKVYDYFPMGNETTWTKMAVKSIVDDARKRGKRYIALAPANFYQMRMKPDKQKIEQFYGLGSTSDNVASRSGLPEEFMGGPEGMGKFRSYKRNQDTKELEGGKLGGKAVMVKSMEAVAKELGAKVKVKKIYHTDPSKPYKIMKNGVPDKAFKTKYDRDIYIEKVADRGEYKLEDISNMDDPRNFVESIVIDLGGTSRTQKMKGYKRGGLVEVKREFFAPLF